MQANTEKSALILFKGDIRPPTIKNTHIAKVKPATILGFRIAENL